MTDTTTPPPDTTPPPLPPAAGDPPADLAGQIAALTAQVAELAKAKEAAEAAAAAAARERMTDAEKLAADRAELDKTKAALVARARGDALGKLGVLEKAWQWAPQVDPTDPVGAKALEEWAKANPELVKAPAQVGQPIDVPASSPLAELLAGKRKSPLLSAKWAAKLLGG